MISALKNIWSIPDLRRRVLFTFAMLGDLELVKQCVEAIPGIQKAPGPHGITLLEHARNGKSNDQNSGKHRKKARAVEQYLESLGELLGRPR